MLKDKDIREPLFDFLEESFGRVRIIEEKTMGKSRADVVMVTEDSLYGIEIKSDADTYTRLAGQIRDYDKFFDHNIVVIGTTHAGHIFEHVPDYWGVITVEEVDGKPDFYIYRKPGINPKVEWKYKLRILWRPELAYIQEKNGMPKYKNLSKYAVIDKIIERLPGKIPEDLLKSQVSYILFERDYNNISAVLQEYRKGEIQKQLEKEKSPEKQVELIMRRLAAKNTFAKKTKRRRKTKK